MTDHITVQDTPGGVRLIGLDRPQKKNALTGAMYDAMREALVHADASGEIGAVVFAGLPGIFTAGNDLADFVEGARTAFGEAPALQFIRQLARTQTPMVAAVDGIAVGIGTTLTLHCDLVYVSDSARFRMPFVELGLVPEAASSYLLPRRVGLLKATEFLLLSEPFDAATAVGLGLANGIIPSDMLVEHAVAQASRLAALPRGAIEASRKLIRWDQAAVEAALEAEAQAFEARLRSPEAQSAFKKFLDRAPKPAA
ncbi:enoyl-CoA hydratase-related protein [Methylobacterium haplocladii]|uniref:Enoyl-CoA hydratase n=1 Tax=Methylobacterium haplocladii TaxID=1176176 RepID=A0A512INX7_9HYPH|nr:enoyl-CoA hydratase-related protein [Methylobacterium haplocladii]GEO99413.1 enoyl-CoA hydratase [Methylobacterium haplocladii]GJD83241.1 2,3-dehydroadipyl-CoA hydratase [Methylobacterium haplocladii]GLS60635.1 enoyl-CoA hydratase [Methylobacterium haplocladii]